MDPVTLKTERLTLRPWRDDDLAPLFAINGDPESMRYFAATMTRADQFAATMIAAMTVVAAANIRSISMGSIRSFAAPPADAVRAARCKNARARAVFGPQRRVTSGRAGTWLTSQCSSC